MDTNLVKLEVDDKEVEIAANSTVMDAANKLGIVVPHFCYHKKLSIAANCRMCLVQVEKAPKPLPACATPVSDGMKVWTKSDLATKAQKGVMEFLLINHPLDCPICDQGGECQLQDLAVGYGSASSRFAEKKRVVKAKSLGPLVSAEEMARCIHCTRCVRFGKEVAGVMELGMQGRGEHSQIISFVDKTIDSELSGNMIDVCPVGALTSKPFRFAARSWELTRLKSISPHDSLGSNLSVQVHQEKVVRVLPFTNEAINECWLSDRDRFSYDGLNSESRLTVPMIRNNGVWNTVDWSTALQIVAQRFKQIIEKSGPNTIGFLGTPQATLEELYLQKKISMGIDSDNFDFRLQQEDFQSDTEGVPWLGMKIIDLDRLDRILLIGGNLRKEQPLLCIKFRKAIQAGAQLSVINPIDEDFLMPLHEKIITNPSNMLTSLSQILNSIRKQKKLPLMEEFASLGTTKNSNRIAKSLLSGTNRAIFLGNLAEYHSQRSGLINLAGLIAKETVSKIGFSGGGANTVGGNIVRSLFDSPQATVPQILSDSTEAFLMLHAEADLDFGNSNAALDSMGSAKFVVSMTSFDHPAARKYADLILPVSPFSETGGSFINMEGTLQKFTGVVKPLGETRPAWKVLRVLGNFMGLKGFDFNVIEDVQDEINSLTGNIENRLDNTILEKELPKLTVDEHSYERIGEIPIYRTDGLVRRSGPLQKTRDGMVSVIGLNSYDIKQLGLTVGEKIYLQQGENEILLTLEEDKAVPRKAVRLPGAFYETSLLGPLSGQVYLKASKGQVVSP